jgi:serine/threonine-protein kinase RsbT
VTAGAIHLPVHHECDVIIARKHARELALREGFSEGAAGAIATAVSELARNIVVHARGGEVLLEVVEERGRRGIAVVARDEAPGIADVELAMKDGWSTGKGLGLGLPSAKRLMDELTVESVPGKGTTVTAKKWTHGRAR